MPSVTKRKRSDDDNDVTVPTESTTGSTTAAAAAAAASSNAAVLQLKILPRDQWKKDGNYRLICKIDGCTKRGRTEKDDMCKRHYTMFRNAGRDTTLEGESKKTSKKKKKTAK
jgi:hypothetical protein